MNPYHRACPYSWCIGSAHHFHLLSDLCITWTMESPSRHLWGTVESNQSLCEKPKMAAPSPHRQLADAGPGRLHLHCSRILPPLMDPAKTEPTKSPWALEPPATPSREVASRPLFTRGLRSILASSHKPHISFDSNVRVVRMKDRKWEWERCWFIRWRRCRQLWV